MSPQRFAARPSPSVVSAVRRFWVGLGGRIGEARQARRWSIERLAQAAGVSRWVVYLIERGEPVSIEAMARVAGALGLRLDADLIDVRRHQPRAERQRDPVHAAMGEFEVGHLRRLGLGAGLDEPYQHYQFAGRADVVAWHVASRCLLHIENRTRFPDFQEMAGSYNAKRAYLGRVLADRFELGNWASETHVIAALWSAEALHSLRLRTESFRTICPDPPVAFEEWWDGRPPGSGKVSTLIVLDPLAEGRRLVFVGLERALSVRPRYRGYADAASAMIGERE